MVTISLDIQNVEQKANLEKVFAYLRSLQMPFKVISNDIEKASDTEGRDEDESERLWAQNQLFEKYVKTGEWEKMDDDERQDASLAEMMYYSHNQPDYAVLSDEETESFLKQLENGTYAD